MARRDSTEKHLLLPSGKPLVSVDALYLILSLLFLQKFPALKQYEFELMPCCRKGLLR